MAIDYNNVLGEMDMECDECSTAESFDGEWQECLEQAKENGWSIEMVRGEWDHYCEEHNGKIKLPE